MLDIKIPPSIAQHVYKTFMSEDVAWYYSDATCNQGGGKLSAASSMDVPQFCHYLFYDGKILSGYFSVASKIVEYLEQHTDKKYAGRLQRVKANLVHKNESYPQGAHHMAHVDSFDKDAETFLYYVNSTDARTYFFSDSDLSVVDTRECVEGTGVLFNSSIYHAGSSPTDANRRVVLNFVFSSKE